MAGALTATSLVALAVGVVASTAPTTTCPADDGEPVRVSLVADALPLQQALNVLSGQIGKEISTIGIDGQRAVSGRFSCVRIDTLMSHLLSGTNYVILSWDERLEIRRLGMGARDGREGNRQSPVQPERYRSLPPSLFPGGVEELPPDQESGQGLTVADVRYYLRLAENQAAPDHEVVPAGSNMPAVLLSDMESVMSQQQPPDDELPVVPPEGEHSAVTYEEVKKALTGRRTPSAKELMVIPPEADGTGGYTLEAVQPALSREPDDRPLRDQVPPD